jgi:hypothetical protein
VSRGEEKRAWLVTLFGVLRRLSSACQWYGIALWYMVIYITISHVNCQSRISESSISTAHLRTPSRRSALSVMIRLTPSSSPLHYLNL